MPLYIKDAEVDRLADELIGLTRTTKVEAVRSALRHEIALVRRDRPLRERLSRSLDMARRLGPFAPGDHKSETDELWGED